jgi:hypothetical protein
MARMNEFRGKGRPSKYKWGVWLDGKKRRLIKGKHFETSARVFISSATHAATRRGLKVRSQQLPSGDVLIQSYSNSGPHLNRRDRAI